MPDLNLDELDVAKVYGFLMCAVVPRPIALVTTLGANAVVNVAPFSSFVVLSPKPPIVGFVCGGWEGRRKDTLVNIERSGAFVINIVAESMAEAVERCATALAPDESEAELAKLTLAGSTAVSVPRLAEAPLSLECRLSRLVDFGDAPDRLVAGRVVNVHAAEGVWQNSRVNRAAWRPLGRVGGGAFCGLSAPFTVRRQPG